MIISKFFGLILMLAGGWLLLVSGGCTILGVFIVIGETRSPGGIITIISMWPMALLTLLGLVLGWFLTKYAYRMLTGKKDEPPEDVIQSEQGGAPE